MIKVKICCIQSIEETQIAIEHGAFAIGLVSKMPSGPGVISEEIIREIAKWSKGKIKTVLLTALQNADELIDQIEYCETDIVQLVDSQEIGTFGKLKKEFPNVEIMQVIHVIDTESITKAVEVSKHVDKLLLDTGNPNLKTKVLGGTGKTHNWKLSKKIVDEVDVPVFLAGGLNPNNVSEAISQVQPFGVDLCSGLRTNNILDRVMVKKFLKAVAKGN